MRIVLFLLLLSSASCRENKTDTTPDLASQSQVAVSMTPFIEVEITPIFTDSISVRAMAVDGSSVFFAGDKGFYGHLSSTTPGQQHIRQMRRKPSDTLPDEAKPNGPAVPFRSIAVTDTHYFILSIGSPALLYKVDRQTGEYREVFRDDHPAAFYDSMEFWNQNEGIAMGDPQEGCLRVIITRDGGETWKPLSCSQLPATVAGEAAFAASDTNISIVGDQTWILSGGIKSRVFYSPDKGKSWSVTPTPLLQGGPTLGGYSMDFYNDELGIIYGGDYTTPSRNLRNIAITRDGGSSWQTLADSTNTGYRSCVQFVPKAGGKHIVAIGFPGISYSADAGETWRLLSKEPFLSFRFVNDSIAFASGRNRIARLYFK